MNKKILLTVVAGSFLLAMILVGCGADRTTGTVTEGIIEKPAGLPAGDEPPVSGGAYCYSAQYNECISMEDENITAAQCTANGGSVVSSCN